MRLAAEQVPGVRTLASIEQLKFKAPVPPGALLDLTLTHDASRHRVQFAYRLRGRDCTSGVIVYRGICIEFRAVHHHPDLQIPAARTIIKD